MPPFIARKRRLSTPPGTPPAQKGRKPTLFETADEVKSTTSVQANQRFLDQLNATDSDSSLSDAASSDFEDALPQSPRKRQKVVHGEEEEEMDWEDAIQEAHSTPITQAPLPTGDLELTLDKSQRFGSMTNPHDKKKGPSKIERQIRTSTHCMHVQFLMFHNLVRNGWCCDKEVQRTLVNQLPAPIMEEVAKWKRASGIFVGTKEPDKSSTQRRGRGRPKAKGGKDSDDVRSQRDWGKPAARQEVGVPDLSRGDPILRLLKLLAAYWKKRFRITAPGLRKQGYKTLAVLEEEVASFHNDNHDPEEHGEKIADMEAFRECAKRCEGSRDVGAQLFTALVRGLGIQARFVASLQPAGFGWSKVEDASAKKKRKQKLTIQSDESDTGDSGHGLDSNRRTVAAATSVKVKTNAKPISRKHPNQKTIGGRDAPIKLPDSSDLSSAQGFEAESEDESVVDVTPSIPQRKPNMNYDNDLPFPIYWTEVISPVSHDVYPVDPMVLVPSVATRQEHLASFEPRGAKADKAKQVIAYVLAYSQDGSAKDVTTRYLKRHMWPGKTKGMRMPVEKVPILNKRGKVKRYEEYDWFKTAMSGYTKHDRLRTIVDNLEESKDLKPIKPEKKEAKEGEETLQGYKQSAEYVLERHLRREEALLPAAQPVKTFTSGKGDKAKEEPVYRRKDVVICRTGESWHKEGRQIKIGEHPMKMVPVRAMTLTRKREVEEAEREGGEKMMQGMFFLDQTEWIIPPPIEDGVIPKNAFGNMDCFVPTMVPKGAIHIPLRGTMKICKRLGIDYAEAVTGFEFGNQRAVPVITGVIVAEENENILLDAWEKDEEERRIKEEGKREKAALGMWRKFLMGLRIVERVREEYGGDGEAHLKEDMNPFTKKGKSSMEASRGHSMIRHANDDDSLPNGQDHDTAGGFLPEDDIEPGGFLQDGHIGEVHEDGEVHAHKTIDLTKVENPDSTIVLRSPQPLEPSFEFIRSGDSPISESDTDADLEPLPKQLQKKRSSSAIVNRDSSTTQAKKSNGSASRSKVAQRARGRRTKSTTQHPYEDDSSEAAESPSASPRLPRNSNTRLEEKVSTRPKRNAARKSETAVRSHYFTHNSDNLETDLQDISSGDSAQYEREVREVKPKVVVNGQKPKAKRGRPRKTM